MYSPRMPENSLSPLSESALSADGSVDSTGLEIAQEPAKALTFSDVHRVAQDEDPSGKNFAASLDWPTATSKPAGSLNVGSSAESTYTLPPLSIEPWQGARTWKFGSIFSSLDDIGNFYTSVAREGGAEVAWHRGARPSDKFSFETRLDGEFTVVEPTGERLGFQDPAPEFRDAVLDAITSAGMDPAARSRFIADMIRFESRARRASLSESSVSETYEQIDRLLTNDSEVSIFPLERVSIARQVMAQAANPSMVDQGVSPTCSVATVENRLYVRQPDVVARIVADAALTGKVSLYNGQRIDLPESNLEPNLDAWYGTPYDGNRSFASQIFQLSAINAFYQGSGKDFRYTEFMSIGQLVDESVYPPEHVSDGPGLRGDDISQLYAMLTGDTRPTVIQNSTRTWGSEKVITVDSAESLARELLRAEAEGMMPMTLGVNTDLEPFADGRIPGTSENAWHVVNVTDFDEQAQVAFVDNQWGSEKDFLEHGIPIRELFQATFSYSDGTAFEAEELARKDFPDLEGFKLELKKVEYMPADLKHEQLVRAAQKLASDFVVHRDGASLSKVEYEQHLSEVGQIFDNLPEIQRQKSLVGIALSSDGFPEERLIEAVTDEVRRLKIPVSRIQDPFDRSVSENEDGLLLSEESNSLIFALWAMPNKALQAKILDRLNAPEN